MQKAILRILASPTKLGPENIKTYLSKVQYLNQVETKFNVTGGKVSLFTSLFLIKIDHLPGSKTSELADGMNTCIKKIPGKCRAYSISPYQI